MAMQTYTCFTCKRTFERASSLVRHPEKCFCSPACYKTPRKEKLTCVICGKEFYRTKSKVDKNKSRIFTCSRECYARAHSKSKIIKLDREKEYFKVSLYDKDLNGFVVKKCGLSKKGAYKLFLEYKKEGYVARYSRQYNPQHKYWYI